MRPHAPCLGCESRSELCHGSCTAYKAFKVELERVKAEERKVHPADAYESEQIWKRVRRNLMSERRNRKQF